MRSTRYLRDVAGLSMLLCIGEAAAQTPSDSAPPARQSTDDGLETSREPELEGPTPAGGATEREAEAQELEAALVELNADGVRLYSEGQFAAAQKRFAKAYKLRPAPSLLFNIASCMDKQGEREKALATYERFLAIATEEDPGRARAETRVNALRDAAPASPRKTTRAAKSSQPPRTAVAATPREERSKTPTLEWYLLGGGLGVAALSATSYFLGRQDHKEVRGAVGYHDPSVPADLTLAEADSLVRSGDTKKTVGAIGAGLGVVLLGAFTYFQLSDDASAPAAVSGFFDGNGGGLSYQGRF